MRTHNDVMVDGGTALFRVVRFWSRRWASGVQPAAGGEAAHVAQVLVLEAIDAAGGDDGTAQIAEVAAELGLDRSNASRMVAAAVRAGLVTKTVSGQDARRTEVSLTAAGQEMLTAAHDWQAETFAQLTAGWPSADVRRFSSYLARLAGPGIPQEQP